MRGSNRRQQLPENRHAKRSAAQQSREEEAQEARDAAGRPRLALEEIRRAAQKTTGKNFALQVVDALVFGRLAVGRAAALVRVETLILLGFLVRVVRAGIERLGPRGRFFVVQARHQGLPTGLGCFFFGSMSPGSTGSSSDMSR